MLPSAGGPSQAAGRSWINAEVNTIPMSELETLPAPEEAVTANLERQAPFIENRDADLEPLPPGWKLYSLTVKQLKKLLSTRGSASTGNKEALVRRLLAVHYNDEQIETQEEMVVNALKRRREQLAQEDVSSSTPAAQQRPRSALQLMDSSGGSGGGPLPFGFGPKVVHDDDKLLELLEAPPCRSSGLETAAASRSPQPGGAAWSCLESPTSLRSLGSTPASDLDDSCIAQTPMGSPCFCTNCLRGQRCLGETEPVAQDDLAQSPPVAQEPVAQEPVAQEPVAQEPADNGDIIYL